MRLKKPRKIHSIKSVKRGRNLSTEQVSILGTFDKCKLGNVIGCIQQVLQKRTRKVICLKVLKALPTSEGTQSW